MVLTKSNIDALSKVYRLNLINSITGIKPGNLIGTISSDGTTNLAIISSVVHLSSKPARLGFITRSSFDGNRDTFENIRQTGQFTINHINTLRTKKAHQTSAKYPSEVSEFVTCGFTERYHKNFSAPFVGESNLKIGLTHIENILIPSTRTTLIVGEVVLIVIADACVTEKGNVDLEQLDSVGIGGLSEYYRLVKVAEYDRVQLDPEKNMLHEEVPFTN